MLDPELDRIPTGNGPRVEKGPQTSPVVQPEETSVLEVSTTNLGPPLVVSIDLSPVVVSTDEA